MEQFDWQPGGKELLQTIEKRIQDSGGNEQMYHDVFLELYGNSFKVNEMRIRTGILKMYGKVRKEDMPTILGIDLPYFLKIWNSLKLKHPGFRYKIIAKKIPQANLKTLRQSLNLSQQGFSTILGITRGAFASYEYGMANIPTDVLLSISKLYNIEVNTFVNSSIQSV